MSARARRLGAHRISKLNPTGLGARWRGGRPHSPNAGRSRGMEDSCGRTSDSQNKSQTRGWASETEVPSRVPGVGGWGWGTGRERVEEERLGKRKKPRAQRLSKSPIWPQVKPRCGSEQTRESGRRHRERRGNAEFCRLLFSSDVELVLKLVNSNAGQVA